MLVIVLAVIAGAGGALLQTRRAAGVVPGAIVTWLWITSILYPPITVKPAAHIFVRIFLILLAAGLGYTGQRVAGANGRKRIDIPLDKRIVYALFSGFVMRGVISAGSTVLLLRR
jgi:hypothetical protein